MTQRKSPTAVLHEGPRALTSEQVRQIEESDLSGVLQVDIDDVIEHVHKDLKSLPDFTTLYRRYLKQRWDVYDLDFTQDKADWNEKMTGEERQSFIAVASGSTTASGRSRSSCPCAATYVLGMDYADWKALPDGYDAQRTVMYRKIMLEDGDLLEFFKAICFFVECVAVMGAVPAGYPLAQC